MVKYPLKRSEQTAETLGRETPAWEVAALALKEKPMLSLAGEHFVFEFPVLGIKSRTSSILRTGSHLQPFLQPHTMPFNSISFP